MPAFAANSVGVGVSAMLVILHSAKSERKPKLCSLREAIPCRILHYAGMDIGKNAGPNYLRAWREHRRMTQEELAAEVGTTGAVISLLEEGKRGLSAKWLRKLAPILNTTPGHLLDHNPGELPSDIFDIWSHIEERERPRALRVLETFRTGTEG